MTDSRRRIPQYIAYDLQNFVLTGFDLGFSANRLKDLVKYEYNIDISQQTVRRQIPELREKQLKWNKNYRLKNKDKIKEYKKTYNQRPEVKERKRIKYRKKHGSDSRELLEIPYRLTDSGKGFFDLGMVYDGGYEHSPQMVILNILNEFPSTIYEILDDLRKVEYYNSGNVKALQLAMLNKALNSMEKNGWIAPMEYFPEWFFECTKPEVYLPDWLFECDEKVDYLPYYFSVLPITPY